MATTTIARYTTAGGSVVTVEETRTWGGLLGVAYTANCSGCRAGFGEEIGTQPPEMAEGAILRWAERHAAGCHRLPTN